MNVTTQLISACLICIAGTSWAEQFPNSWWEASPIVMSPDYPEKKTEMQALAMQVLKDQSQNEGEDSAREKVAALYVLAPDACQGRILNVLADTAEADRDHRVRHVAIRYLGPCVADNWNIKESLLRALNDADSVIRHAAIVALGPAALNDKEIREGLEARFYDENEKIRVMAVLAFKGSPSVEKDEALRKKLLLAALSYSSHSHADSTPFAVNVVLESSCLDDPSVRMELLKSIGVRNKKDRCDSGAEAFGNNNMADGKDYAPIDLTAPEYFSGFRWMPSWPCRPGAASRTLPQTPCAR